MGLVHAFELEMIGIGLQVITFSSHLRPDLQDNFLTPQVINYFLVDKKNYF